VTERPDKGSSKKGIVSVSPVLKNPVVAFLSAAVMKRAKFFGGNPMQKIGLIKSLSVALFLLAFLAGRTFADDIILTAPDYAKIGNPFTVMVTTDDFPEKGILSWRGIEVPLDFRKEKNRYFALVMLGSQADEEPVTDSVVEVCLNIRGKTEVLKKQVTLKAVTYPVQHLSVPKKMVTPPEEVLDRVRRESAMVKKALAVSKPGRLWEIPFVPPLEGAVTSPYGTTRTMNGVKKGIHTGVDLRAAVGTSVVAPAGGMVVLADDLYFAGKCVYIDHGNGVFSVVMHLSEIAVKAGDTVRPGDLVGKTGRSGRVTGPHLHFGVRVHGKWVNPLPLVAADQ
jgi:murein DD-endopeptidase MepM/ murein hydrolase activator NlpD